MWNRGELAVVTGRITLRLKDLNDSALLESQFKLREHQRFDYMKMRFYETFQSSFEQLQALAQKIRADSRVVSVDLEIIDTWYGH